MTTCTMCKSAPATTRWVSPVCDDCADGLKWLHGELARKEAADESAAADELTALWDGPDYFGDGAGNGRSTDV